MRPRRTVAVSALLLALPAGAGCGGAQAQPEETMEGFLSALGREDTTKACEYWVAPGTNRPIGTDEEALNECLDRFVAEEQWQYTAEQLEELREAEVTRADVSGDRARIVPEDIRGVGSVDNLPPFELLEVRGKWYLYRMDTPETETQ